MKITRIMTVFFLCLLFLCSGCADSSSETANSSSEASSTKGEVQTMKEKTKLDITEISTDCAMYQPGEKVKINVQLKKEAEGNNRAFHLVVQPYHVGNTIGGPVEESIEFPAESDTVQAEVGWDAPQEDYQGYLLAVSVNDEEGQVLAKDSIGVDVSSTWVKYPRYGYVCRYEEDTSEDLLIEQMNRYHLNAIEYYDWQYLHHKPLVDGITKENPGEWKDWSGRVISGKSVAGYIQAARKRHMASMAYDMIYAGTDTFFQDENGKPSKAADWKLYFAPDNDRGSGEFKFHMGTSPSGNGNLFFVNPLNKEWQQYIFQQINQIFTVFDFDGWHGDSVGEWGPMTDTQGNPLGYDEAGNAIYQVKDTYTQFLNAAKAALKEKYLSFNPVGAQGIQGVNASNTDVLYAEFWPWDSDRSGIAYETYASIAREVERSMEESRSNSIDGKGKSLVVKAYINYYKTNGFMNAPAVLLCDAAVYAAGGSRLELGDGSHMLHKEYYPEDTVEMDEDLTVREQRLSDFIVAYENLLRDGQKTVERNVVIQDCKSSSKGNGNAVWTYSREDVGHEILHLINFMGTNNRWRDEQGKKPAPEVQKQLRIKYYTDQLIDQIYLASPDTDYCQSSKLEFTAGSDSNGTYLSFIVPSLEYWDMIYMRKKQ